jgi:hypothetical protein
MSIAAGGATLPGMTPLTDAERTRGRAKQTATESALGDTPEKFVPIARFSLLDRLTATDAWGDAKRASEARRFFLYLDRWRRAMYTAKLESLEQAYEPFSPDSDLLITRTYSPAEKARLQRAVMGQIRGMFEQANYTPIDPANVEVLMTEESHYGLDLHVDLKAFEELLIFYRGRGERTQSRRSQKRLYLTKEEYKVPILKRFGIVFKLKTIEARAREVMVEERCDMERAVKRVKKMRASLPAEISSDYIYMKLFKNIPQTDLEMVFPNTRIRFRLFDKLKLGATAGGGIAAGVVGAAGKIALITSNPVTAAGAALGLGGVLFRQGMNVVNQKNRYMITMAQNLYFHSMADNRSVMTKIADRAADEDIKEEMLLYSVLAKERVRIDEIDDVDRAIERYLDRQFEVRVDFDVADALGRLIKDGIVTQGADGTLTALQPTEAAAHVDAMWDSYLDHLPSLGVETIGHEFNDESELETA